jgi:hypothetical protein
MKDVEEFIDRPNPIFTFTNLEKSLRFSRSELKKIAKDKERFYHPFELKLNGKSRLIDNPTGILKQVQESIQSNILSKIIFRNGVFGGIKTKSNIDNANFHRDSSLVVRFDIKKFYPSTKRMKVTKAFIHVLGYGKEVSTLLSDLCCRDVKDDSYLAQGSPASTLTANLVFLPVFKQLKSLADSHNLKISIFVDDIFVSGDNIDDMNEFITKVYNTIYKSGYKVSQGKVKVMRSDKIITGVVIKKGLLYITPELKMKIDHLKYRYSEGDISEKELKSLAGMVSYSKNVRLKN